MILYKKKSGFLGGECGRHILYALDFDHPGGHIPLNLT